LLSHLLLVVFLRLEIELHRVSNGNDGDILLLQNLQSGSSDRFGRVDAVDLDAMTGFPVSKSVPLNQQQAETYQLEVTCKPQFQADRT
jgi:hypothetical protein